MTLKIYGAPRSRTFRVLWAAEAEVQRPLGVLDAHLATRKHMLGGGYTIADLNIGSLLYSAWFNKADLSRWPQIQAWLERVLTRPAALKARRMREV